MVLKTDWVDGDQVTATYMNTLGSTVNGIGPGAQGPPGAPGSPGATGQTGAAGPTGPAAYAVQTDVPVGLGASMSRLGDLAYGIPITGRGGYYIPVACTNLRLVYTNWKVSDSGYAPTGDLATPADMPIKAGLEVGGTIHRLTFNGQVNPTISPLGQVISDPLAVDIPAGTWIYVRTFTDSISYYNNRLAYIAGSGGVDVSGADLSAPGSGSITDGIGYLPGPSVILGTPATPIKTVFGVGDSIMDGAGDGAGSHPFNATYDKAGRGGFLTRAAKNVGFGLINVAVGGEWATEWNTAGWHTRRLGFAKHCRTAVCDYGNNDVYVGNSLSTIQADLIKVWTQLNALGLRVFATNNLPRTVSTDGFITTANQTTLTGETVRVQLNNWLRDGAPITIATGVAAATGVSAGAGIARCNYFTVNTITKAAENSHPLYGSVEVADTCESSRDSGKWRTPYSSRSVTDAAATAASYPTIPTVTSSTASFTTADIGKLLSIAGAGPSGGLYLGTITQVNSSTSVGCAANGVNTTVSGAAMKIIDYATADGTHPGPSAAEDMAGKLPTNYFL